MERRFVFGCVQLSPGQFFPILISRCHCRWLCRISCAFCTFLMVFSFFETLCFTRIGWCILCTPMHGLWNVWNGANLFQGYTMLRFIWCTTYWVLQRRESFRYNDQRKCLVCYQ